MIIENMTSDREVINREDFISKIERLTTYDEITFTFGEWDELYSLYYGIKKINIFDSEVILIGIWGSLAEEVHVIRDIDRETIETDLWHYMNYLGILNYDRDTFTLIYDH